MIIQRNPSLTLQIQQALNNRMKLSPDQKRKYEQNQKGYEGEILFDRYIEKLNVPCLILKDIWLKVDGNKVQIDFLLITDKVVYIFEVKNFSGNFYYRNDSLYLDSEMEVFNPMNQIKRSKIILTKVLRSFQKNITIESAIVFINPKFVLYQGTPEKDFILFNQLETRLAKLKREITVPTQQSHQLVKRILDEQYPEEVRYEDLPEYEENTLRKGITCQKCHSFSLKDTRQLCICLECGYTEKISDAINRSVKEYQLLFPYKEITKNSIHRWMGETYSPQRIRRVLLKHYSLKGEGKASYYI